MQIPAHMINSFTRSGAAPTHAPVSSPTSIAPTPIYHAPAYVAPSHAAPQPMPAPSAATPLASQLQQLAGGTPTMSAQDWAALLRHVPGMQSADPQNVGAPTGPIDLNTFMSYRHLAGLGTATQDAAGLISGATGATSGIIGALTAASAVGVATGIGAAVVGLIAISKVIYDLVQGCGETCIAASNIANQVGDQISQAMHLYMSQPVHYESMQTAYLNLFDTAWAQLQNMCSNPQLGSAGQACISDRQAGACKWTSSPGGWNQNPDGTWTYTWAGPAGSGTACWNYFNGMRDPVANDPTVVPDPPTAASEIAAAVSGTSTSTTDLTPLLLVAALIGLAVFL